MYLIPIIIAAALGSKQCHKNKPINNKPIVAQSANRQNVMSEEQRALIHEMTKASKELGGLPLHFDGTAFTPWGYVGKGDGQLGDEAHAKVTSITAKYNKTAYSRWAGVHDGKPF